MIKIVALFADWANGIFAVLIASFVFGVDPEAWHFVVGVLMSHSPDIDAVPELLKRGRVSASAEHTKDHRTFLHYPALLIGIAVVAYWVVPYWGFMFLVAVSLHMINDLYGTGWGIKLFWPLSNYNFKLLGRRANRLKYLLVADGDWDSLSNDERRLRFLVSWSPDEMPSYIEKWGIDDWIYKYYLNFNYIAILEYFLFLFAIALMCKTLLY